MILGSILLLLLLLPPSSSSLSLHEIEARKAALSWPMDVAPSQQHLLRHIDRCDFQAISCQQIASKIASLQPASPPVQAASADDALRTALSQAFAMEDGPDGPLFAKPVLLTECDQAMGFIPTQDLSKTSITKALMKGNEKTTLSGITVSSTELSYHHHTPSTTGSVALGIDAITAITEGFYFDPRYGTLLTSLDRSDTTGNWLEKALVNVLGGGKFYNALDSIQQDGHSIAAHDHSLTWLYLASGLKFWTAGSHENPPPAEVQWSLPLNEYSWLREGSPIHDPTHDQEGWEPLSCMQKPGDVVILPHFVSRS